MPNITPSNQEINLMQALKKRGVEVESQHWDGYKHVDLYIPDANLYIEVDGIQHYTDPKQFQADLIRDHYSDDEKIFTKHISNQLVDTHLEDIADAIFQVVIQKRVIK